jgi:hypothetical protein
MLSSIDEDNVFTKRIYFCSERTSHARGRVKHNCRYRGVKIIMKLLNMNAIHRRPLLSVL